MQAYFVGGLPLAGPTHCFLADLFAGVAEIAPSICLLVIFGARCCSMRRITESFASACEAELGMPW